MGELTEARDCRTCEHNIYKEIADCDFFCCGHPITLAKTPKWIKGDPMMVNYRTGDVHLRHIEQFAECPTWRARAAHNAGGQDNG